MTIDWTFRISDVLTISGGVMAFVWMTIHIRDSIRDLSRAVGSRESREGLWEIVSGLKDVHADVHREVMSHREWIIRHDAGHTRQASYD